MLKIGLKNGYVIFAKYSVETGEETRTFHDNESKDAYINSLGEIEYTVTEYEQPSAELLQAVEGRKFNTLAEAREFIQAVESGIIPKSDSERINDLELLVLQLGGII